MICKGCNRIIEDTAKFCPHCGAAVSTDVSKPAEPKQAEPKKPFYKRFEFILIASAVVVCLIAAALIPQKSTVSSSKYSPAPSPTATPTPLSRDEYIELCETPDYKTVARSPSDYVGDYFKFKGKVIQIQGTDDIIMRVEQDDDYDKIWIVAGKMPKNMRILEDDEIIVYGVFGGLQSYTTVLGAEKTLPLLAARYYTVYT